MSVTIRQGTRDDLAAINGIYNHYIRETAVAFDIEPWSLAEREAWYVVFGAGSPRHRLLVAEDGGRVIGFTCSRPFHPKAAYDITVETTIALDPDERGRGTGSMLYRELFAACRDTGVRTFVALVTQGNPESHGFHEALGFRRVGVLPEVGRKFDRLWDVGIYVRPNA